MKINTFLRSLVDPRVSCVAMLRATLAMGRKAIVLTHASPVHHLLVAERSLEVLLMKVFF